MILDEKPNWSSSRWSSARYSNWVSASPITFLAKSSRIQILFIFFKIFLIKTILHKASLLPYPVLFANWLKIQLLVHEFSVAFAFWCIIPRPPCGWVGVKQCGQHHGDRKAFNKIVIKRSCVLLVLNPPSVLWFHWIKRQGPTVEIWFQVVWSFLALSMWGSIFDCWLWPF